MADAQQLRCKIEHHVGALSLSVEFSLTAPWTMLFGPSGSGKSTVLRVLAGFVKPQNGLVTAAPFARALLDTAAGIDLAPHQRPVRFAPQLARLMPHRSVLANVRYGMDRNGMSEKLTSETVQEVLELFRIRSLTERRPAGLSGGEMQRVAVARAVLAAVTYRGPQRALLLLDEPFHGLDFALRNALAPGLRKFLRSWKIPVLSVSHDVVEAYLLEAEVLRLADGQVVAQGPVSEVLAPVREELLRQLHAERR